MQNAIQIYAKSVVAVCAQEFYPQSAFHSNKNNRAESTLKLPSGLAN